MLLQSSRFYPSRLLSVIVAVAALIVAGHVVAKDAASRPVDVQGPVDADGSEKAPEAKAAATSEGPSHSERTRETKKGDVKKSAAKTDESKPVVRSERATSESAAAAQNPKQGGTKKNAESKKTADLLGEPLASGMMKLLQEETLAGIQRRGAGDRFARFQRYANGRVNASAGAHTGSELAGNCRIRWYDHLMRNMTSAPTEAERFTRQLHEDALDSDAGLGKLLAVAAEKMDRGRRKPHRPIAAASPEQALDAVRQAIVEAQTAYCDALAPLSKSEIRELQEHLVPVLSTQNHVGHTLADRGTGRRMCDLMEKMDIESLDRAAEALAPLADVRFLEQLKQIKVDGNVKVSGVTGVVLAKMETPAGAIVIGGRGPNTYQLDQMRDVAAVVDLGGNDVYSEGTVGVDRPVLLLIDLAGDDAYRGAKAGIQGGSVLGVSMLLDLAGNDTYQAQDVAQGSTLAGIGILIDYAGNDRYTGVRRLQGQAVGGVGILIDRAGNDDYHAGLWAQGMGGPLGFGVLDDLTGNDHYYCGGMWRNSYYPETPGMEGWGQGVGAGLRQVANGGVGVILDGAGDDVYEFDYLAHGGGYWCGVGFARDFGGNDQRLITRTAYNGGPRSQTSFQRFGCGWGCHYALGFLFDDAGNDVYEGTIMGTGMAWDCSMGVLCDFAGNDHYKATGGLTQGTGAQMGFGVLFDYNGDDTYDGYGQGYANGGISYHPLPDCGGNFSFVVDYGGHDTYGCGAGNNDYVQRGDTGGFVIDRPRQDEVQPASATPPSHATAGR